MRKRAFDLTLTVCGAALWVPVVLVGAMLVLVGSGRPVFYRSRRRVSREVTMRVVKFRTMVRNADRIANRDTIPVTDVRFLNIPPDSPLYTRVGRFLERFGITELPQFVHVLTGRMSLVGNRPLPENVMVSLREEFPHADTRFLSKAGLTGPAQLVGRAVLTDDERLHLEGAYCLACVQGYSIRLDVAILLRTMLIVLGVLRPMTYQEVLDLIARRERAPRRRAVLADQGPAAEAENPVVLTD